MTITTPVVLPTYTETPIEAITEAYNTTYSHFRTLKTKDINYRKVQLRKLYWALTDYHPQLEAALLKDLRKHPHESAFTEVEWVKNDCMFMLSKLDELTKDEHLGTSDIPWIFLLNRIRIHKEPLGTALIIGTYNFPVMLLLGPLVGAIAAGCTAVCKPSEGAPATAAVIEKMIHERLDTSSYRVVNGAVPEVTALLEKKWDKIFYTGSQAVGKIVAKKAAETLTPVTLELGGRNPAFVTKNADLKTAAKRLLWGKTLNAGQVCLSSNYIMVERPVLDQFIRELGDASKEILPAGTRESEHLGRIVNERQFLRMKKMLEGSKGKIVMGGEMVQDELFIEPTAVLVDSIEDSMIVEESFGPIFAIMPYDTLQEALATANKVDDTPLTMFTFGNRDEFNTALKGITSGGADFNDAYMHAALENIPFGGVGQSGTGSYRGRASFHAFTHRRSVAETPLWADVLLRVRYMPYRQKDLDQLRFLVQTKPNFNRDGVVQSGILARLGWLFGLGGKGALLRGAVITVGIAMILMMRNR